MLVDQYAKTYKKEYQRNVIKYGKEKALKIWHELKAETLREKVHNEKFMDRIVEEMKRI